MAKGKDKKKTTATTTGNGKKKIPKGYKEKADIPHVSDLLAFGAPETANVRKTWKDKLMFPLALFITFVLSFFVFDYMINNFTTHKPIKLPNVSERMRVNLPKKPKRPAYDPKMEEKTFDQPDL